MSDVCDIKIGIIGLGHIGAIHIRALTELDGFQLTALCDSKISQMGFLSPNLPKFSNHHDMLNYGDFETVVIATPNQTHYDFALEVLSAGFNVIVEKPAANTKEQLSYLEREAKIRKKNIYYAFHSAMASEILWFKKFLHDQKNQFGPITSFNCKFYDPYYLSKDNFRERKSLENCWQDSGVNALSVIEQFMNVEKLCLAEERQNFSHLDESDTAIHNVWVRYNFSISENDSAGFGVVETAWDRGINHKSTELFFAHSNCRIILNHSIQAVEYFPPEGTASTLKKFDGERLLNHYLNLFSQYRKEFLNNSRNSKSALSIHKQLFKIHIKN